jgi:hypothetical protein
VVRLGPITACAAVGASLWFSAVDARAYCPTRTCNPLTQVCDVDANGCVTTGTPIFWATSCVSFGVAEPASTKVSYADAQAVITAAYQRWISVDCGGSYPSIDIVDKGAVTCGFSEYNTDAGNANVWSFRDDGWDHADSVDGTLALTFVTYDLNTGEIYDADVEINSFANNLTVGDTNVGDDLDTIVTHEIGHFLGLSHTNVAGATMSATYVSGDTSLRTLEADDIVAMCATYPPGRQAQDNAPACDPRHGLTTCIAAAGGSSAGGSSGTGGSGAGNAGAPPEEQPAGATCRCALERRAADDGGLLGLLLVVLSLVRRRNATRHEGSPARHEGERAGI